MILLKIHMLLIKTIKEEFGQEVADLVEGVTKISVFENQAINDQANKNFLKLKILEN